MKTLIAVVAVLVAAVPGAAYAGVEVSDPAPETKAAEKWEYGELRFTQGAKKPERPQRPVLPRPRRPVLPRRPPEGRKAPLQTRKVPPPENVIWITAQRTVKGKDWEGIAKELKVATANETPQKQPPAKLLVFNALGAEGWELASFQPATSPTGTDVWTFKRRMK
jgi:hypothetical protein